MRPQLGARRLLPTAAHLLGTGEETSRQASSAASLAIRILADPPTCLSSPCTHAPTSLVENLHYDSALNLPLPGSGHLHLVSALRGLSLGDNTELRAQLRPEHLLDAVILSSLSIKYFSPARPSPPAKEGT